MLTARWPVQDAADVVLELMNAGADYNAKNEQGQVRATGRALICHGAVLAKRRCATCSHRCTWCGDPSIALCWAPGG